MTKTFNVGDKATWNGTEVEIMYGPFSGFGVSKQRYVVKIIDDSNASEHTVYDEDLKKIEKPSTDPRHKAVVDILTTNYVAFKNVRTEDVATHLLKAIDETPSSKIVDCDGDVWYRNSRGLYDMGLDEDYYSDFDLKTLEEDYGPLEYVR